MLNTIYANSFDGFLPPPVALPVPPLMMERVHMTFEQWFVKLFRAGLLPTGNFSIMDMETQYKLLCMREEILWKEWINANQQE